MADEAVDAARLDSAVGGDDAEAAAQEQFGGKRDCGPADDQLL